MPNLYMVQDSGETAYILAPNIAAAIAQLQCHVAAESGEDPSDSEPEQISLLCLGDELIVPDGLRVHFQKHYSVTEAVEAGIIPPQPARSVASVIALEKLLLDLLDANPRYSADEELNSRIDEFMHAVRGRETRRALAEGQASPL